MSDPILNYRFVIFLPNFIISFTKEEWVKNNNINVDVYWEN